MWQNVGIENQRLSERCSNEVPKRAAKVGTIAVVLSSYHEENSRSFDEPEVKNYPAAQRLMTHPGVGGLVDWWTPVADVRGLPTVSAEAHLRLRYGARGYFAACTDALAPALRTAFMCARAPSRIFSIQFSTSTLIAGCLRTMLRGARPATVLIHSHWNHVQSLGEASC